MRTKMGVYLRATLFCLLCLIAAESSFAQTGSQDFRRLSQDRSLSRIQTSKMIPVFPEDKTVIDMTVEDLRSYYPSELRRLQFSSNQDELGLLLAKMGERLQNFFQDFANTSSRESVLLQRPEDGAVLSRDFYYLISYRQGGGRPALEEIRTDKKYEPVRQEATGGFFITSGYVGLSLNFHPGCQETCRFRYLGKQTSNPAAHIVAFTQKPEAKDLQIEYTDVLTGVTVHIPVQGIVWVDPETYQVFRMRVNLLGAENRSYMTEQSTDIKLSEIRFDDSGKKLWLPREVIVNTLISGIVFRNQQISTAIRTTRHSMSAATSPSIH